MNKVIIIFLALLAFTVHSKEKVNYLDCKNYTTKLFGNTWKKNGWPYWEYHTTSGEYIGKVRATDRPGYDWVKDSDGDIIYNQFYAHSYGKYRSEGPFLSKRDARKWLFSKQCR
ncbi:hypothetical protein [Pseudoalteromonas marina]|uniref:hypothetical protein n=1 Tax=Pseudoalteromonas marina TaxID=267375 RepID=UPI0023F268F1|nr:hypothetical protein [Pseudoalteromonas marina]